MAAELSFDREACRKERLAFIRSYVAWVKRMPNAGWSREQAELVDRFYENGTNIPISSRVYTGRVTGRKRRVP